MSKSELKINLRAANYTVNEGDPNAIFETIHLASNRDRQLKVGDYGAYGTSAVEGIRQGSKAPAKFGWDVKALETICTELATKDGYNFNVLQFDADNGDAIYAEVELDKELYCFIVKGDITVEYKDKALPEHLSFLPIVFYCLRDSLKTGAKPDPNARNLKAEDLKTLFAYEIRERFLAILNEYAENEEIDANNALIFSDTMDYGFLRTARNREMEIIEDSTGFETAIKIAGSNQGFSKMSTFKKLKLRNITGIDMPETQGTKERLPDDEFFANMLAGKYLSDYPYTAEQRMRIPSLDFLTNFVHNETFFTLANKCIYRNSMIKARKDAGLVGTALIGDDYINCFIVGKPGTGKTTTAYALGAALGMPVYTVPVNKHTESDTFEGMNKIVDGQLRFMPTDFLKAFTEPCIIVLEEINLADPAVVMGTLGQAVEFPFTLLKDGYIPVTRGANTVILGTFNVGTYGSRGINEAFSSRFHQTYILDDPTDEDFIKILKTPENTDNEVRWVYRGYKKVIEYIENPRNGIDEEMALNVTLRACKGALKDIAEGADPYMAMKNSIIGKIRQCSTAVEANNIYEEVILAMDALY